MKDLLGTQGQMDIGDSWNHIEDAWNHIKFGIYVSILGSQGHIRDSGKYQGLGSDIEESGSDSGD